MTKGGYKQRNNPNTEQQLLLGILIDRAGGPTEVSRLCGVYMQSATFWRNAGHVPVKYCDQVAKALGLDSLQRWALNFDAVPDSFEGKPLWKDVVLAFKFPKELTRRILTMK